MPARKPRVLGLLTMREAEVVANICLGESHASIANKLCVAEKTIKFHCSQIYKKLKCVSKSQLISEFMLGHLESAQMELIQFHFQKLKDEKKREHERIVGLPRGFGQ